MSKLTKLSINLRHTS